MAKLARALVFGTLLALGVSLAPVLSRSAPADGRLVCLARGLSDEGLVVLGATLAARGDDSLLLLDSDKCGAALKSFLEAYHPARVVPVGSFSEEPAELEKRLGTPAGPALPWSDRPPPDAWRALLPRADSVVVCPALPRGQLLQAACLAGVLRAPLLVRRGDDQDAKVIRERVAACGAGQVFLVGSAADLAPALPGVRHVRLADEEAAAAAHRRRLREQGPVSTIVLANPADTAEGMGGLSALAPWVALQKHAALVLTGPDGTDADEVVLKAVRREALRGAENLLLVANLQAVPWQRRPNPIPGKDADIEMEPLTPTGNEPFSFATGRLFHEDPAVVPLVLARQRLLAGAAGPRKALVVSNPGGGLPLLETLSRSTAGELRNAGYQTTTRFGKEVSGDDLRRLLPEHHVFLWEGHQATLMREYDFPSWDEPLPPSLVFLQSCLALAEPKAGPLFSRGAVAVLGTSTRTYSGSGGACSLAFFNALLYDGQPVGGALRQSKNFLLACTLLKEKRLGKEAARNGAGLRAAWAFTLWGDPTLRLPPPEPPAAARPPVRHEVAGNTIVLQVPKETYDPVQTEKYEAAVPPNARLAGLLRKERDEEDRRPLVPLVFAEVHLPKAHAGQTPRLSSKLPSAHWVFSWDARRRTGYLLASPRPQDAGELRFHVHWPAAAAAGGGR
jgi:hypothetical protein